MSDFLIKSGLVNRRNIADVCQGTQDTPVIYLSFVPKRNGPDQLLADFRALIDPSTIQKFSGHGPTQQWFASRIDRPLHCVAHDLADLMSKIVLFVLFSLICYVISRMLMVMVMVTLYGTDMTGCPTTGGDLYVFSYGLKLGRFCSFHFLL